MEKAGNAYNLPHFQHLHVHILHTRHFQNDEIDPLSKIRSIQLYFVDTLENDRFSDFINVPKLL